MVEADVPLCYECMNEKRGVRSILRAHLPIIVTLSAFLATTAGMSERSLVAAGQSTDAPGALSSAGSASAPPAGHDEDSSTPALLDIETVHLSNGLTVIVAPQPGRPSFSATIHYKVGASREWQGLLGATELVGKLLLDGSPTLGTRSPQREKSLLYRLDRLDAEIRARSSADHAGASPSFSPTPDLARLLATRDRLMTELERISSAGVYSQLYRDRGASGPTVHVSPTEVQVRVTLPANQLSYFFAVEAARISSFSTRNFYLEREALARSRAESFSDPGFQLMQGLVAEAFHVHPFGRYRADPDSIRGVGRAELEYYHRLYFKPSQTIVAIAGGVTAQDVRRLSWRYLGAIPFRGGPAGRLEPVEPPQQGERRLYVGGADHAEVLLAFHLDAAGIGPGDPTLPVLVELLQDPWLGTFSPLWLAQPAERVADRIVATEYPPSPPLGAEYPSLLIVGARAAGSTQATRLEAALRERLAALAVSGPGEDAVDAARKRARSALAESMARASVLSSLLARACATTGRPEALLGLYEAIPGVSASRLLEVAKTLFAPTNTTVAVMAGQERPGGTDGGPAVRPAPRPDGSPPPARAGAGAEAHAPAGEGVQ